VVLNLGVARFECTFGRGCEGICCHDGRPLLYEDEIARIDADLPSLLASLRPEARSVVQSEGYLTRRRKRGHATARVHRGWCIFFNQGCTLHCAGLKPAACALFPLDRDEKDRWYVRQWGFQGENWELPCLNPESTATPAAVSLQPELDLARRFTEGPDS
jgi:hypothetical protein